MNEEERRKIIIDKWMKNPERPHHFIARELNLPRSTVDTVLKRYFETKSTSRRARKFVPLGPRNSSMNNRVVGEILRNRQLSVRDVAKKCGTNEAMVQRVKKRNGLKTFKKQKVAKTSEKQRSVIKTRARKLYDYLGKNNVHLILDDETYVKADFATLPGPQYYTKFAGESLPRSQTSVSIEKFGTKYLVWQAICECGRRSSAFVTNGTINKNVYINDCLKKRLVPFIRSHAESTLFWPDLATCHYAKDTVAFMENNGIQFVPKIMNPPNVPQCRPIERYWAIIKANLRKSEQKCENIADFRRKWNSATKRISSDVVGNLMKGVRVKLRREWESERK